MPFQPPLLQPGVVGIVQVVYASDGVRVRQDEFRYFGADDPDAAGHSISGHNKYSLPGSAVGRTLDTESACHLVARCLGQEPDVGRALSGVPPPMTTIFG
jgi:hypothetical protein